MENKSSRNVALVGTAGYTGLLILALFLISLKIPQEKKTPPDGIDVTMDIPLTEIDALGGSDMDYGTSENGGGSANETNSGTNAESSTNVTTNNSDHSTNNSNVHSNTNSWNNVWNTSNNSNGQGSNTGDGDQGSSTGTIGGHGTKPCKGCTGSGYDFGNGTALYLAKPNIDNGDEGRGVVKVKFDKNGNVQEVYIKQKGTYGSISDDSWSKIKKAAYETKFPADAEAGNQLRTGYLSYDLHPN
jgi:hypothetical protein